MVWADALRESAHTIPQIPACGSAAPPPGESTEHRTLSYKCPHTYDFYPLKRWRAWKSQQACRPEHSEGSSTLFPTCHPLPRSGRHVGNSVLVDTNLFQPATRAKLHGDDINAPRALKTGVQVKIVVGGHDDLALLRHRNRIFWPAVSGSPARLHLHKDEIKPLFGDKIDLSIATTEITLQNTISAAYQFLSGQAFTCATKPVSCPLHHIYSAPPTVTVLK